MEAVAAGTSHEQANQVPLTSNICSLSVTRLSFGDVAVLKILFVFLGGEKLMYQNTAAISPIKGQFQLQAW